MSSEIKANKLSPGSGSILTIGDSGDTVNIDGTAGTGFPAGGLLGLVVYTADGII